MSAPLSQSGEKIARWRSAPVAIWLLILATFCVRLVAGSLVHLTEDEAYYRLWSMTPALGYYDHPPMIAWWVWIGRHILGDTSLGVRLLPILAPAITTGLVYDITRLIGGDRPDRLRAAFWYNAMWLVAAGGILAVPDAAAELFWALTIWCVLRAEARRSITWWLAAGIAAGLAALSKYSSLFLAPGVLIWLCWRAETRKTLLSPGPWLAALAALALFSVNILWNADHQWMTFTKQFGRIAPKGFAPVHLLNFLLAQLFLLNPFICMFILRGLATRDTRSRLAPLFLTSAPFAAYLVVHSIHDSVQAHWPAPLYPALAICAAIAAHAEPIGDSPRWRIARRAASIGGLAIYPLLIGLLLAPTALTSRLLAPVIGWRQFAQHVEAQRTASGAAWVGTLSYGLAAQLSVEPALRTPVLQITERERYSELRLPTPDLSRAGLLVDLQRRVDVAQLHRCFSKVVPLPAYSRVPHSPPGKAYDLFIVSQPRRDVLREGC
jgi:4-amino-4-deoxy-L-arabinose transferase-like glycosyltransferase